MENNLDELAEKLQREILDEARRNYSETVIDHWMKPRSRGILSDNDGYGKITGSCGDTMEICFKIKDGKIIDAGFNTDGCGTTIACGSMVTELILSKSLTEARGITQETVLKAVGGLPEANRHCALLAANTLYEAIKNFEQKKEE
ncbi:MAG: iron-sulfur cluster assembly scaffold protein [Candidatus Stahlbacteria bacterium]|nr:iron-sulfur cluster assembly scaffold protein [Candidatus Stahlbacteria bacterium]